MMAPRRAAAAQPKKDGALRAAGAILIGLAVLIGARSSSVDWTPRTAGSGGSASWTDEA